MTKSLLIGLLLLTMAARASAQIGPYTWVSVPATASYVQPPNAVIAPAYYDSIRRAACKGQDSIDRLWAGFIEVNTTTGVPVCASKQSGIRYNGTKNLFVLTLATGTSPRWMDGIGPLTNMVNAGPNNLAKPQYFCARVGFVGVVESGNCATGTSVLSMSLPTFVLSW